MTVKIFALLLFATLAGTVSAQFDFSEIDRAAAAGPVIQNQRKIKVGQAQALRVGDAAAVAIPIQFTAGDYSGPYDPADPNGVAAAARRRAQMEGASRMAVIKSYIPPGMGDFAKKEAVKLAVSEGKRFAFSHPVEAAEIVGIATKTKALYTTATKRLKDLEKKQAIQSKRQRH